MVVSQNLPRVSEGTEQGEAVAGRGRGWPRRCWSAAAGARAPPLWAAVATLPPVTGVCVPFSLLVTEPLLPPSLPDKPAEENMPWSLAFTKCRRAGPDPAVAAEMTLGSANRAPLPRGHDRRDRPLPEQASLC